MKIIVDIPKQDYIYIAKKHCLPSCDERTLRETYYEMIAKGVPLPKGHGRLGDLDMLEKEVVNGIKAGLYEEGYEEYGYEEYGHINDVDDCVECIKWADTIIEADRGDEV